MELGITNKYSTLSYAQCNGQVEATDKLQWIEEKA